MEDRNLAIQVIESLRSGIPPQRGINLYSVGNERLIDGVKTRHLSGISDRGIIRFISGSWGAGKTHFFRQLREVAFEDNCLVSNVELDTSSAALNKFQTVFAAIIRQITTPLDYSGYALSGAAHFGAVVSESLAWLGAGERTIDVDITNEQYERANLLLMADPGIDIDFKKMIQHYWKTFLPEAPGPTIVEQTRGEILQWFSGEGTIGNFQRNYGVGRLVSRENARLMLQSLSNFIRLSGYKGLLILFDEAEQAYSVMRRSALLDAHNNLLSLINNIENLPGLFLIYATTPDFFTDPNHGIVIYGALSGRIGQPEEREPRALQTIWNLDAVKGELEGYQEAAKRIRAVYILAYPEAENELPDEVSVAKKASDLLKQHAPFAAVRFWRLLVTALVTDFDDYLEGEPRTTGVLYEDVMDRLREV